MFDKSKLNNEHFAIYKNILSFGISEVDAQVILDCIVAKRSCSWVNNDHVDEKTLKALDDYIIANNFNISIKVDAVPTRNKYVWEIKAKR